ncbi:hypothetical protein [Nevskia soli]|uniref:hypothetical protein n=1 Tax=Nevskia soli TaxID=418856 RepID=UPI0012FB033A|nr:hypothetical protein [Nevskia soli]
MAQKLLLERYRERRSLEKLSFRDVGFGLYSQHDEDGILLYIFSLIGVDNYRCVEICAGNGIECNTANLLINHRWTGLLVDGNPANVAAAKAFYRSRVETMHWLPDIVGAWLTRENINDVVANAGYSGEIDLLSLDVDGVDYWLWDAIQIITPRVVVLEYNHLLGPEVSLTVPYQPDFVAEFSEYGSDYAGASLQAFIRLGCKKGYRFVGTNAIGTNAFFVRNDIPTELLAEADPKDAYRHPRAQFGMKTRYQGIKDRAWVEV